MHEKTKIQIVIYVAQTKQIEICDNSFELLKYIYKGRNTVGMCIGYIVIGKCQNHGSQLIWEDL